MKFEFDSNNATELRAVKAAVAVMIDRLNAPPTAAEWAAAVEVPALHPDNFKSPLVATVTEAQQKLEDEQPDLTGAVMPVAIVDIPGEADMKAAPDAIIQNGVEVDSAGQPWNAELHSSSRAKLQDGTWKKKRGVKTIEMLAQETGLTPETVAERLAAPLPPATSNGDFKPEQLPVPPVPPAPPVPVPAAPAAPAPTSAEGKIWALISGGVVTVNQALEAARAAGLADLGALRQADEAKKLEVLRVLEGE